jgi:GWxTD domain-containing protein
MMHLKSWLETPLAAAIGWTLFHSLWEGAMIAVLLAATLAFTRSARGRYIAACLAMCAIVVCFAVTLLRLAPRRQAPGAVGNPIALTWNTPVALADLPPGPLRNIADFLPWLVPFWIAGVVLFYLRHLVGWAMARRLRRTGVCAAPDFWQEKLRALADRIRLSRPVGLLESCLTSVPVVMGHLRPVILVPVGLLTGLPAGQIESILLHELAHIRRYDYLVNMLQTSLEGLLFYHPVVWWISGVIRTEREHCCDDLAVALSGDAHQYAVALAALEQSRWDASHAVLAATGGNLVKRIRRLLIPSEGPSSALTPFVSAGILMITAAVGLTAWQAKAPDSPYSKWLNEDAAYIITNQERAAYQRLETDAERAQFVEQFWLRRDPTPDTPKNEFKEEHYRRIAYANLHFPTATGTSGWKTDRGRIYILYGPPDEIDDHSTGETKAAVPFIDWTYRYLDGVGSNVKMEFVDPTGTNDFRMTRDPHPPTQ